MSLYLRNRATCCTGTQTHERGQSKRLYPEGVFHMCESLVWISVFRSFVFSLFKWLTLKLAEKTHVEAGCGRTDGARSSPFFWLRTSGRFQQPGVIHGHLWKCWFVWNASLCRHFNKQNVCSLVLGRAMVKQRTRLSSLKRSVSFIRKLISTWLGCISL